MPARGPVCVRARACERASMRACVCVCNVHCIVYTGYAVHLSSCLVDSATVISSASMIRSKHTCTQNTHTHPHTPTHPPSHPPTHPHKHTHTHTWGACGTCRSKPRTGASLAVEGISCVLLSPAPCVCVCVFTCMCMAVRACDCWCASLSLAPSQSWRHDGRVFQMETHTSTPASWRQHGRGHGSRRSAWR